MVFKIFILLFFCTQIYGEEILGCGGFIKTEVEINFSLIEVKLYTKQGSLKYQTDCAPNNGYYMLPVYNKGEYLIKVEGPSGWTFEPTSYNILIDGKTDKCTLSEDINFQFTGFGVVGNVWSKGQDGGPQGVLLVLKLLTSDEVLRKATSGVGGGYIFDKVLPGEYVVEASHPIWMFESAKGKVSLTKETGKVDDTIIVSGFDVRGRILSDGEPVSGVNFFLYGKGNKESEIKGCSTDILLVPGVEGADFLCYVTSNEKGHFVFPAVQSGNYFLRPFYNGEKIKYDVTPSKVDISVHHDSVVVKEPFQVAGFLVSGKVRTSEKGAGIPGATVYVNKSPVAVTNDDGIFHLEAMKTGKYELKAAASRMQFDILDVKVSPNTPILPDLIASKFDVCGRIIVDVASRSSLSLTRNVVFHAKDESKNIVTRSKEDGSFCIFITPGTYKCSVEISEEEKEAGFRLLPYENIVKVVDAPLDEIIFSQFHAKISGIINCLDSCGTIQLTLSSLTKIEDQKILDVSSDGRSATFQFENVMTGNYELTMQNDKWCWLNKTLNINVIDKDVEGLVFGHSGYMVVCSLSHNARMVFDPLFKHSEKAENQSLHFDLSQGLNKFCLKEAGAYLISIESCHQFETDSYKYDTALGGVLSLTAILHKVEISLTSSHKHNDIMAIINNEQVESTRIGPLQLNKKLSQNDGGHEYVIHHWAKAGERLTATLESGVLLFEPALVHLTVKSDLCPSARATFKGRQGAFVEGGVAPPLIGVEVTVSLDSGKVLHTVTDEQGRYRIGPIDANLKYETSVSKSCYAFNSMAGQPGFFKASKLAEIIIKVNDDTTGVHLPGVLFSLSGEESFRRNNVTQENETLVFTNLGPGQYFLKPMMKEYEFEPSSQFIEVAEGATVQVDVVARRIAFSCYGHVTSLNGEPEVGVHVEAANEDGELEQCQGHQEESKTGLDGSIRIRGLKPGCSYILRMKEDKDLNIIIERTSPKQIKLQVSDNDIRDMRFVAFRRINVMDISGRVVANQEYLSSIKVHLMLESNLDAPQHSTNLGPSPFFYFSSVPIDNQSYLVRLTSSLSQSNFDFSLPELKFHADSPFKHFTLHFHPQPKVGDQELTHTSLLVLPLTLLILYIYYNRKQVFPFVSQYTSGIYSLFASRASAHPIAAPQPQMPTDSFNTDLLTETSSKKKQKAKKI